MAWPPRVGELLPRAEEATGVQDKLATYSLNPAHEEGAAKARGFALILGIAPDSIDYLAAEIHRGICESPVAVVRVKHGFGVACAVDMPIRGLGRRSTRIVALRTAWLIESAEVPPRLTSAYLRP
jgi:hypothetical protein